MTKKITSALAIAGWIVLVLGYVAFQRYVNAQAPFEIKKAAALVSDCQYPTRPLSAAGSCDNTDPACPETIKDPVLHGNCAPAAYQPMADVEYQQFVGK